MTPRFDPRAGARSLIEDAIGAQAGQSLAIIAEDPSLGIYDALVPEIVADVAGELGIQTTIIPVGNHVGVEAIPEPVALALDGCDHVLFHARMGDTMRFADIPGTASKTMSYALDASVLGGPSCTVPHRVMTEIKKAFDAKADKTRTWHITCNNGTDLRGTQDVDAVARGEASDFTVTRYPVCAPRPLSCSTANGVVALTHWLMASGNRAYSDDEIILTDVVMAHVEDGRIKEFEGPTGLTDRIRAQYARVGALFDIDPGIVHSWHAGINPGCGYPVNGARNIDRWGRVAFANPRYLHFHTCGDYAPGEIAWSIFDASVWFDGVEYWNDGKLTFLDGAEVSDILERHEIDALETVRDIGIDGSVSGRANPR